MSNTLFRNSSRTVPTAVAAALLGGLVVFTPTAASAEPRPRDTASCSVLLQRALDWPESVSTPQGDVRYVSDAFYSYLLRQPECAATRG